VSQRRRKTKRTVKKKLTAPDQAEVGGGEPDPAIGRGGLMTFGNELRELLAPLTPDVFLNRYWEREPLYIPGKPDKFSRLFDREAFDRAVLKQKEKGILIRVSFDDESRNKTVGMHVSIKASQIDYYYSRGASVCVDPIERGDENLAHFAAAIKSQLNHAGGVSVKSYLSPGGAGFNTHFDAQVATTLQIEGRKRWRFSRQPALAFPRNNGFLSADGVIRYSGRLPSSTQSWERVEQVDEADFMEVILEPGDVLCLPPGTWHNAKAIGHSLALNLSFAPLNFLDLLYRVLAPVLASNLEWRRNMPAVWAETKRSGILPPQLEEFFRDRLNELQEIIATIDPTDSLFHSAWREAVLGNSSFNEAAMPLAGHEGDDWLEPQADEALPNEARSPHRTTSATGLGKQERTASPLGFTGGLSCSLSVKNLKLSVEWYRDVLGFQPLHVINEYGWSELATASSDVRIGLSEINSPEVKGGAILNFGVSNLEDARRQLEAKGVRFDGPTHVIYGLVKLATFSDPDGNKLMLYESLQE
jgi:ribosomal protein L16 Arg81 hydroxylase/catechol 2,3-dioxygenase-like lactoylglutathione lyase family enzyme